MRCTIILVEVGLCRDLGCDTKLTEGTEKYSPLVGALEKKTGDEWSSSLFPSDTRVPRYKVYLNTSQPHSISSTLAWNKKEPPEASLTST